MPDEGTPQRIGYVLKMYPRFSETFVVTEILALQDQGADLDIFSLRPPVDGRFHESLSRVRAPVTYLPSPGKPPEIWGALAGARELHGERFDACIGELLAAPPTDACQALLLAGLVRERGITHLHAHFGTVAAGVARLAARIAGITYSVTLHAKDIFHEDVDDEELAARISDAAAVVTVSDFNERYLRERYGDATRNARAHLQRDRPGGVHALAPGRPAAAGRRGRPAGREEGLPPPGRRGRPAPRPGPPDPAGAGRRRAPRSRRSAPGWPPSTWTTGSPSTARSPRPRPATAMRAAAVLAAPCVVGLDGNRDGLPTVILESLALGTPVVATPVTGIPEAVLRRPDRTPRARGRRCVALADALDRLVEDADLRCRLAEQGRRHVEEHFDTRKNTGLLHAVIGARGRRAPGRGGLMRVVYVSTDEGVPTFGTKGSSVHVQAMLGPAPRPRRRGAPGDASPGLAATGPPVPGPGAPAARAGVGRHAGSRRSRGRRPRPRRAGRPDLGPAARGGPGRPRVRAVRAVGAYRHRVGAGPRRLQRPRGQLAAARRAGPPPRARRPAGRRRRGLRRLRSGRHRGLRQRAGRGLGPRRSGPRLRSRSTPSRTASTRGASARPPGAGSSRRSRWGSWGRSSPGTAWRTWCVRSGSCTTTTRRTACCSSGTAPSAGGSSS